MRSLTYNGGAGVRVFGVDDGLDVERRFTHGEALAVSEADAQRILDGPHADEFTDNGPAEAENQES